MGAFNLEYEQRRIGEFGIKKDAIQDSLNYQLRSLLAERTETVNPFTLYAEKGLATAKGFDHRGDLSVSYEKSVEEAKSELIARRFQLENDGYKRVKEQFFEVPLYSTFVLFSPPPEIHIEGYPGYNQAYFYHILPGEHKGQRTIKALSFINWFEKQELADIINNLTFSQSVKPTERSILMSPAAVYGISKDATSFRTIWKEIENVYQRRKRNFPLPPVEITEQFLLNGEELWKRKHKTLSMMTEEMSDMIAKGATEEQLRDKWAILFNLADQELLHKDVSDVSLPLRNVEGISSEERGVIFDRHRDLSYRPRAAATSCGPSGSEESTLENQLNSLGIDKSSLITTRTFTIEDAKNDPNLCRCGGKEPHFHCPGEIDGKPCKEAIVVGKGITKCSNCGTGKVC